MKLTIEKYMSQYSNSHFFSTCSLRIPNTYGNHQDISKVQGVIPIIIDNILNIISEHVDKNIDILYKNKREPDVPKVQLNHCKAAELLGWKPTIDLSYGIKRSIEEMRSNV